jgi:hypothetical protein
MYSYLSFWNKLKSREKGQLLKKMYEQEHRKNHTFLENVIGIIFLYLPASSVSSKIAEGGGEPVVDIVQCQLLVGCLQDGLKIKKKHYDLLKINVVRYIYCISV